MKGRLSFQDIGKIPINPHPRAHPPEISVFFEDFYVQCVFGQIVFFFLKSIFSKGKKYPCFSPNKKVRLQ